MVSTDAARTAVGILGNIFSIILFMSPVPTFIQILKKGSVEQYSPAPYLATLISCGFWVVYGLPMVHPHSLLVITITGTGMVVELVYLFLFLWYSNWKKRVRIVLIMVGEFVVLAVLIVLVLNLAHTTKLRSNIVGSMAMLGNIMAYASPLLVMRMVILTKSVEYMPLFLSLATFASCICWTAYGLIRFDPFIAWSNGLGTLLGLAQLILYATFYKSTKRQVLEKQGKGEMGLAEPTIYGGESKKTSTTAFDIHMT